MQTIKIEFSQQQLMVLRSALGEISFKHAAPIIQHIDSQIQRAFDERANDGPTGQVPKPDEFSGD